MIEAVILVILLGARQIISMLTTLVSRFLIRTYLSVGGKPIGMLDWFKWSYLKTFGLPQFASIGIIASFTVVTFPLGMWIYSYSLGIVYPLISIVDNIFGMFMIPLNMLVFNKVLGEITFGPTTIIGIVLLEVAMSIAVVGWYLIYLGGVK